MKTVRLGLALGALAVALIIGTALAALPPQVDPTTVPLGALVVQNRITDDPVESFARVLHSKGGVDVFIEHIRLAPGQSSGWHTHDGPVIVNIVSGTLTLYDGDDKTCTPRTYGPGRGFIDHGFGHVHIVRNESSSVPVDLYATFVLPSGTEALHTDVSGPEGCPPSAS